MTRNLINNQRIPPLGPDDIGSHASWEFYRNVLWEMRELGSWGKNARSYRLLRLAIAQYITYRNRVQSFTTFEELIHWINTSQFEVYACPHNILNNNRVSSPYDRVILKDVKISDISTRFFSPDSFYEDDIEGDGWSFDLHVYPKSGPFNINCLILGLAAYGVYSMANVYEHDEAGISYYRLSCHAMTCDFTFTDADDVRWAYNPALDDEFEDDDLEDLIGEEEHRARWFEDGYKDDDIDGLFDGYR